MAIVTKTINGYGPYEYRVTYEDGKHHWEYIGRAGESDESADAESEPADNEADTIDLPDDTNDDIRNIAESLTGVEVQTEGADILVSGNIPESATVSDEEVEFNIVQRNGDVEIVQFEAGSKTTSLQDRTNSGYGAVMETIQDVSNGDAKLDYSGHNPSIEYGDSVSYQLGPRADVTVTDGYVDDTAISSADEFEEVNQINKNSAKYSDDEVAMVDERDGQYGTKVAVKTPYDAKDAMNDLDWDDHHQDWNSKYGLWYVDSDSVGEVATHLEESGFDVETREY